MTLTAFLHRAVELLNDAGVPYMLTGSLAAAYYATPRATQDIDVVIEAGKSDVERLVEGLLGAGWYVDRGAALEAWEARTQFNAIDPDSGWKADFIVRRERQYSKVEFQRREWISLLGVSVPIASLEDVLIAKLEWSRLGDSALQRRDVAQLLESTWTRLDFAYLQTWIAELGLESEWAMARVELEDSPGSDDAGV